MRSELGLLVAAVLLTGCDEKVEPQVERFASVKKRPAVNASAFCEKTYPASGEGSRALVMPTLHDFGGPMPKRRGWTWLNLWATWCKPCVEEMGLLTRWDEALTRENLDVSFELLSIDADDAQPALEQWRKKNPLGHVSWLRGADDLAPFLEKLGVDKSASIPVHVLVDPAGMVRCVRVGSIHQENWGAVRGFIAGG